MRDTIQEIYGQWNTDIKQKVMTTHLRDPFSLVT